MYDLESYTKIPYNDNINYQRAELVYLQSLPKDVQWANKGDKIGDYFNFCLAEKNIYLSASEKNYIVNAVKTLINPITDLKEYYNRERPYQLAKRLNINFKYVPLDSAKTPAYPSGHSTQATFVANLIGDLRPELKEEVKYIANDVCFSRLVAGVHFPSDDVFGRFLGTELFKQFKKKK